MIEYNKFRNKTIKEIQIWAWIAAVLPLAALAGTFFIWAFGTSSLFRIAMIVGETTMFTVAVIWWWWAIYVIRHLVSQWDHTRNSVGEVLDEVKEIKELVKQPTGDK